MENQSILIFLNSDIKKNFRFHYSGLLTLQDLQSKCIEKFKLAENIKVTLYDSSGDQISEDDIECLSQTEIFFCSKGEEFSYKTLKAVYKKIKTLGKGGFGTVKLYKNRITKKLVAIKLIQIKSLIKSDSVTRTFKELQLLKDLKHSNIIKFFDVFSSEGNFCFVMEFCEGGEIKKQVQENNGLNDDEAARIGLQIAEAVRFCHSQNVVHRDLKPENVLFRDKNKREVVIVDFGIAGICQQGKVLDNSTAGSLNYLAPEVVTGKDLAARPELDIWSLGCLLFFMVHNEKPFAGRSRTEVLRNIIAGKFSPVKKKVWKPVIEGCLQCEPIKRWKIMQIIAYLEMIVNHEVGEEVKKVTKSVSLRVVKTPEPFVKLPVIKANRGNSRPRKRTWGKDAK
jgi:serine/threonine protein kinase